jgi:chromosome segregation ATPase
MASHREKRSSSKDIGSRNSSGLLSSSSFLSRTSSGGSNISNTSTSSAKAPLSPSRITRLREKEDLQNLNDRLVVYIDTVRRLEAENNQLKQQVHNQSSTSTRDVCEIKRMYQGELEGAKALIDTLAKDIAKKDIDLNKYKLEADEAMKRLTRLEGENKSLLDKLKSSESEAIEYKSRLEALQKESARNSEELAKLRPQQLEMEKNSSKLKKQLEEETLSRIDLENKIQTLKEDLAFKSQIYTRETNQLRTTKMVELEQVDVRLRDEYDSKLVNELNRIRNDTEIKINEMRDDVERRYQAKLADAQRKAEQNKQTSYSITDEMKTMKNRIAELIEDSKIAKTKKEYYEKRITELEESLRASNKRYDEHMELKVIKIIFCCFY